jgi:hypothetical protein
LTTALDLDLSASDPTQNLTSGTDNQPLEGNEITFKVPTHVNIFGGGVTPEYAGLGYRQILTFLDIRLHVSFDDQSIAGTDLTRERNFASDNERPDINLISRGDWQGGLLDRRCWRASVGTEKVNPARHFDHCRGC